jgi:hypothetical protein
MRYKVIRIGSKWLKGINASREAWDFTYITLEGVVIGHDNVHTRKGQRTEGPNLWRQVRGSHAHDKNAYSEEEAIHLFLKSGGKATIEIVGEEVEVYFHFESVRLNAEPHGEIELHGDLKKFPAFSLTRQVKMRDVLSTPYLSDEQKATIQARMGVMVVDCAEWPCPSGAGSGLVKILEEKLPDVQVGTRVVLNNLLIFNTDRTRRSVSFERQDEGWRYIS